MQGPVIDAGTVAPGHTRIVRISNGAEIVLHNLGGTLYHEVEGTMASDAFTAFSASLAGMPKEERDAQVGIEIGKAFKKLESAHALKLRELDDIAYFTFLLPYTPQLMSSLKSVEFGSRLLLNPVTLQRGAVAADKAHTPQAEGLVPRTVARDSLERFSGLERIHAPEFVAAAEADIGGGVKVNGSSVRLGVTDTGLTLNHPTFQSQIDGHNRAEYLKDFSREGRVYFSPAAKFAVTAPAGGSSEDLTVEAEIIVTPKLPDMPSGDTLIDIKGFNIKVSPELRQILTTPGSGAKLGVLLEDDFNGAEDTVDINGNGKIDDKLWMIFVPGATPADYSVYFDPSGTGDFRHSPKLQDWNHGKTTMPVLAETVGFHIQDDQLPKADGTALMSVMSASIVGFDPGNHGSHVTGIAAGSKTLQNDSRLTLARGVAPEAKILLNRVCSNTAGCNFVEAMRDIVVEGKAEVVNMSLGGLSPFNDGYGVAETIVNRLTSLNNTLYVLAAGNEGPGHQTVGTPSTARLSLSVGATASQGMIQRQYQWPAATPAGGSQASSAGGSEDDDFMLFFSSRGPTAAGGFKPNVTAPGTELSSVELNAAPGASAGLQIMWGTSMATPTTTGAFALFLDAVKKYNIAHPARPLAADSVTLRDVLIESARAFDVSRFDPATGAKSSGRYTWVDEGKGMVDLLAAWKLLKAQRDNPIPSSVQLAGKDIALDYQVVVQSKSINGLSYDGTRAAAPGTPALGTGLYLDAGGTDQLRQVLIQRGLPESLASGPDAGTLQRQLETTSDEFVLKTTIYGSTVEWVRAGTLDNLDCWDSPRANLTVASRGVEIAVAKDGTGTVNVEYNSALNVCINRDAIAHQLPQGDNGALIEGYRVVGGKVATMPSFTVPVYITVPHKVLGHSTGYSTEQTVRSFDVSRNYVVIPQGTSLVKITLEVPALKTDAEGHRLPGQDCSGVELMALLGNNSKAPFTSRTAARASNCASDGSVVTDAAKRRVEYSTLAPLPGTWDLHVFGMYMFAQSHFTLKVDYVNAAATPASIAGSVSTALSGSVDLKVSEASITAVPDSAKSVFELSGLSTEAASAVTTGSHVVLPAPGQPAGTGPASAMRKYPAGTKSVKFTTGGSPGNDIDLYVFECDATAADLDDDSCEAAGKSDGPTDVESVTLQPKDGKAYGVVVQGATVKDDGKFTSTETIVMASEKGTASVTGSSPDFKVEYSMSASQAAASPLLGSSRFASGEYSVTGALFIRAADGTTLAVVPVKVTR